MSYYATCKACELQSCRSWCPAVIEERKREWEAHKQEMERVGKS
jgi:hypothetical protein